MPPTSAVAFRLACILARFEPGQPDIRLLRGHVQTRVKCSLTLLPQTLLPHSPGI